MTGTASRFSISAEKYIAFLLLIYPILLLTLKGGMNGGFLLLLLISIGLIFTKRHSLRALWDRDTIQYTAAMISLPLAIFISQSYHQHYSAHPYDAASRFLLAIPVFIALRRIRLTVVAALQYGFPLGAIAGLLMAKDLGNGTIGNYFLIHIYYGDLALMLGALSFFSIDWTGRDTLVLRILKISGLLAGVYASFLTGARGGWIAIPVFLAIYYYFKVGKISGKWLAAVLILALTASLAAYSFNQNIHQRIDRIGSDIREFRQGNPDTSLGVRAQLWKAAIVEFVQNPVVGVGPGNYWVPLDSMAKIGIITPIAAEVGHAQIHNEILSKLAELGVLGFLSIALIYLVPLKIFFRSARSALPQQKHAGTLGIVLVSGFIIFGLSVEILDLTMTSAFYSLTVAVLLAACLNTQHAEHQPSSLNQP